jgi:HD-like signal output (HDOD) protein
MLSRSENLSEEMCDYAFTAGLLHDTGKLVLATRLPEQYSRVAAQTAERKLPFWRAEQEALGASHAEVGAYLLGLWGFCDAVVEALTFHHCPQACPQPGFTPLTAVHVANAFSQGQEPVEAGAPSEIDMDYLQSLRLAERLPAWRAIACKAGAPKEN